MHLGRLEHLPFPLISTVSMVGMSVFSPALLYLNGQMSIFNMGAPGFIGSWKNYTPLKTAEAFINPANADDGGYPGGGIEETWLSAAYLRDEEGYAGTGLSWALIPDVHGELHLRACRISYTAFTDRFNMISPNRSRSVHSRPKIRHLRYRRLRSRQQTKQERD